VYLTIRLLTEIALEIHDATMKSARTFSPTRQEKDGETRDKIRKMGDEKLAVSGLLGLAQKGLEVIESGQGDTARWTDVACQALRTLASWTREWRLPLLFPPSHSHSPFGTRKSVAN
jgi:exportin-T